MQLILLPFYVLALVGSYVVRWCIDHPRLAKIIFGAVVLAIIAVIGIVVLVQELEERKKRAEEERVQTAFNNLTSEEKACAAEVLKAENLYVEELNKASGDRRKALEFEHMNFIIYLKTHPNTALRIDAAKKRYQYIQQRMQGASHRPRR